MAFTSMLLSFKNLMAADRSAAVGHACVNAPLQVHGNSGVEVKQGGLIAHSPSVSLK